MKLLICGYAWRGGMLNYLGEGFKQNNIIVDYAFFHAKGTFISKILNEFYRLKNYADLLELRKYNNFVIQKAQQIEPDILFVLGGGRLFPDTVKYFKDILKCKTVSYISDNPFDSSRDPYVSMSLRHFTHIFSGEKIWIQNIANVSPNSKIQPIGVGFSPEKFYPIKDSYITTEDIKNYSCDISFTGSNYNNKAEGAYRVGILAQLSEYDLRIWGSGNWEKRVKYFPELKGCLKGDFIPFTDLLKLYRLSKINMNLPSPQIVTGFQPRVFEIAAAKGFQIIDYREDLLNYFSDNEIVTFKNPIELKDKAKYFLKNENERNQITENLYDKVKKDFSWHSISQKILSNIY